VSRAAGQALVMAAVLALGAAAAAPEPLVRPLIANGQPTTAWAEVGKLLTSSGACTATLVGCRTVATAAHCVCGADGLGAPCGNGERAERPEDLVVFLPRAGFFAVEGVRIAPGYQFGVGGDLALLELLRPSRSVRPRRLHAGARPPFGTAGTIVGYGITKEGAADGGIQRVGAVTTASCNAAGVTNANHLCWSFAAPVGPAGSDSNICSGDSGGPLLADLGAGTALIGVHSGGSLAGCDAPLPSSGFATDVSVASGWLRATAGLDLDAEACSDGPQIGDPEVGALSFSTTPSSANTFRDFTIPPGTRRLRVALNGRDDPASELDLYVRAGARPTKSVYDCASTFAGNLEWCEIADPPAGSGHLLVTRELDKNVFFQATVTMLPEDPPPPPLPPGGLLVANFRSDELSQVARDDGRRAIVSSALRGAGPPFSGPEGVALDADGSVLVANAFGGNLLRVERETGARTVVSGCLDEACTATRGAGPAFLNPRFVARAADGVLLVADRFTPADPAAASAWALVGVDPPRRDRTVLSGCASTACPSLVGAGPPIGRLFGLAVEPGGATVVVADGRAVYRIERATGDRSIVSGCADAACSTLIGAGDGFGEPVDLLVEPAGTLLVSYRIEGSPFGALRRVDPASGARTLISGCEDAACASLRGAGPPFVDLFGLALDARGALFASDASLDAILHVDRATGDRTLVSGCADPGCSSAAGAGPRLGEPVDLLVAPEPAAAATSAAALAALALAAALRRRGARRSAGGRA